MKINKRFTLWITVIVVVVGLMGLTWSLAAPARKQQDDKTPVYIVRNIHHTKARSAIARTGANIVEVGHDYVLVEATGEEFKAIESLGLDISKPTEAEALTLAFPPADSAYHDYNEMVAELQQVARTHPDIFWLFPIGTSYEGRTIWAGKISDNVGVDEDEPEVLFTHHQHAREHLTVEMALYTLHMLTGEYGVNQQITNLVNNREIWMVFDMNPDGGEYDIATGSYRSWRKNRQPNAGSSYIGTDLNRTWGYRWGCCGGSSSSPDSETYRGASAFSARETAAVRDFVNSRVINGKQQIRVAIDFHTYSELILWPYGYTLADVPADMTQADHDVLAAMGRAMAATNDYTPQQASDLYLTDGSINDWLYGVHRILNFTFEMYPKTMAQGGFYPPDEVIPTETARNRAAILYLLGQAACPSAISPTSQSFAASGGSGSVTVTHSDGACAWTAASNSAWITITTITQVISGVNGPGSGTVNYSVAANTGAARTGTMTIAGQSCTVTQAASPPCTTAIPISIGQTVNGQLNTSDCQRSDGRFADRYSFSGTAGQQIAISLDSTAFDTYLFLLNSSGSVIAQDDDGGGGLNSRIPTGSGFFTLPVTGNYVILASSFRANSTGSYRLSLNSNPCTTVAPISIGQTVNGQLNTADCLLNTGRYVDRYSFSGTAGQRVAISLNSTGFDAYLFLLNSNGAVIAQDDDGNGGLNARIPAGSGFFTLPATGSYTILVSSYWASSFGNYTLRLFGPGGAIQSKDYPLPPGDGPPKLGLNQLPDAVPDAALLHNKPRSKLARPIA